MGAGVAVSGEHVLTAHYIVLGASRVELVGIDGRTRDVDRIALDHESGLALLDRSPGRTSSPRGSAPSPTLRPGDPVFLLTCTGEKERRGASGHVTFVGPFEAFWEYMLDRAIMTTMVNPGLAGGPLFDARARVVGVVSLGLAAVGRFSLAIPVSLFLERRGAAGERRRPGALREAGLAGLLPAGERGRDRRDAASCRAGRPRPRACSAATSS